MTTVWRQFESEQDFTEWHEQAKSLLGMPIVGFRASDGVPQPDKQQTTDYTGLTYRDLEVDSDGMPIIPSEPPLDAVVAQPSILHMVSTLVREDMMTPQEITEMAGMYPPWQEGESVATDDLRAFDGMLWRVVQGHTTQADWTPDVARSLWVRTVAPDVIPEWVQPIGAHDAWPLGAVVTYQGALYESLVAANVWVPGSDPALWKLIEEESSELVIAAWVQPTGGHDAYSIGDRVVHDNPNDGGNVWVYESTINANTTEPGRDGTFDRWWTPIEPA